MLLCNILTLWFLSPPSPNISIHLGRGRKLFWICLLINSIKYFKEIHPPSSVQDNTCKHEKGLIQGLMHRTELITQIMQHNSHGHNFIYFILNQELYQSRFILFYKTIWVLFHTGYFISIPFANLKSIRAGHWLKWKLDESKSTWTTESMTFIQY